MKQAILIILSIIGAIIFIVVVIQGGRYLSWGNRVKWEVRIDTDEIENRTRRRCYREDWKGIEQVRCDSVPWGEL